MKFSYVTKQCSYLNFFQLSKNLKIIHRSLALQKQTFGQIWSMVQSNNAKLPPGHHPQNDYISLGLENRKTF
jgi:hypothetical protein